ncbi:VWA domain-containing protein [uncultured Cohaesibacter sp.]|uniref:VWA domain-containing protein n=1 Tax=uncultured Cohaesibacter sp. TaxID=1002546 RepID=UPI0029C8459D|nr:VWA domain-containing protein [uncultured Cohaesibacter sp.]
MTACSLVFPYLSSAGWAARCEESGAVAQLASWGALGLWALLLLFGLFHLVRRGESGHLASFWAIGRSGVIMLAAFLLAVAAGRPVFMHQPSVQTKHFILVVDQSQSAHRQDANRKARIGKLAQELAKLADAKDAITRLSLIDFAASVDIRLDRASLPDGLEMLRRDEWPDRLHADGSDIAAALRKAEALANEQNDEDVIFLISDGNATTMPLARLALALEGRLHRVFITSLDAGEASEGIVSSYLPPRVQSGSAPDLRIVFDPGEASGGKADGTNWQMSLRGNGEPLALEKDRLATDGAIAALKFPVRFDGRGLQFAALDLQRGEQAFGARVFTLVSSPVRVLGLGDTAFLSLLPKERFEVEQRTEMDISGLDDFDMVVLGNVEAHRLDAGQLTQLADAVEQRGLGLFLVNGPMRGARDEPTVVQSFANTALDPLLPVSPDPKFLLQDPPPRDTIVLVDTSGSMAGGGLAAARLAVADILDYLRPQDSLELITFGGLSTGRQHGDAAGKQVIRDFASRFPSGDSSNVSRAFTRALAATGNYTSVFLITDGMVDPYDYAKAGLSFYYLQYSSGGMPLNDEIAKAARQSQILQSGQGLSFKPDSYDPEERKEFFSPDLVHPRIVAPIDGISGGLATSGVAFSYARQDAIRALVSDGLEGEPVLAFRDAKQLNNGSVGVFLSALDGDWTDSEAGRASIEASLLQLVKWSDRARYGFQLRDLGDEIALRISVEGKADEASVPQSLSVSLVIGDKTIGIPMQPVGLSGGQPVGQSEGQDEGLFEGRFALPQPVLASAERQPEGAEKGLLILREGGLGARAQAEVIPITVPYAISRRSDDREAASHGVNLSGLRAIADATGGALDRLPTRAQGVRSIGVPPQPMHVPLILLASFLFGAGLVMRGGRL